MALLDPGFLLGNVENHGDVIGEKHASSFPVANGSGVHGVPLE